MDVGIINTTTYYNNVNTANQAPAANVTNTQSEAYLAANSAFAGVEYVKDIKGKEETRKKLEWVEPMIKEGAAEIKKDQGIDMEAPVFIERRHRVQAVKVDRRSSSKRRTIQASDAVGMNDYEKAARTNKVGQYCVQKYGKKEHHNGDTFHLDA